MLFEPFQGAFPAVFGSFLAVAGAVVGMEGMRRVGVDHELRGTGGLRAGRQRGLHALHGVQRNAGIGAAVQAQHRGLEAGHPVDRVLRREFAGLAHQAAVPGHGGLDGRVRGVQPGDAPSPVMAVLSRLPPFAPAHFRVASRSDSTWASGTLDTSSLIRRAMSVYLDASPWRLYSSGAMAR